ncbi:MAG: iron ABC transporter permease [Peptococcaceae bacterium]|nr:iron ABC transporter permease [Peptococcaceae bacterium]
MKHCTNAQKGRWMLLFTIFLTVISVLLGISLGSTRISPADFLQAVLSGSTTDSTYRIVMYSRLPGVLGALLAGSALSVSGAILQSVLQNPLASPNIIGVNSGAGLMVLLCSAFFPAMDALLPFAAFLGALATAMLIFALAMGPGVSRITLVLTGIAMSSILGAGMNCIMILYPDAYIGASTFLVGGLSGLTIQGLRFPAIYILIGLILAMLMRRDMNIIALGTDTAKALGMSVNRTRFLLIFTAAILAGAAVSFAGLIGFVGLVVPHAIRFLIGNDNRYLVPASAFGGAAFVILCDLVSRMAFAPYVLPVGILLSFIGGPFFIYLIIRNRRDHHD